MALVGKSAFDSRVGDRGAGPRQAARVVEPTDHPIGVWRHREAPGELPGIAFPEPRGSRQLRHLVDVAGSDARTPATAGTAFGEGQN
jgi:hypothetical protein